MNVQRPGVWVRENEAVLVGLCWVVIGAFTAAVPLMGWPVGWGAVAGLACWVAVCAVVNREERIEHDAVDRHLMRRPS